MSLPPHELKALAIQLAACVPPLLPEAVGALGEKVSQAAGVIALIRASQFSPEPVTREELAAACWCASNALQDVNAALEAAELTGTRHG